MAIKSHKNFKLTHVNYMLQLAILNIKLLVYEFFCGLCLINNYQKA